MPCVPEITTRVPNGLVRLAMTAPIGRTRHRAVGAGARSHEAIAKDLPSADTGVALDRSVGPLSPSINAHLHARDRPFSRKRDADDLLRSYLCASAVCWAGDDRFHREGGK